MKKQIKKRGSFASYRDEKDPTRWHLEVTEMARLLASNLGNIPLRLSDTKAFEIHILAIAYLETEKELEQMKKKYEK